MVSLVEVVGLLGAVAAAVAGMILLRSKARPAEARVPVRTRQR